MNAKKIQALNTFLERTEENKLTQETITDLYHSMVETEEGEFLVLTDEEADERVKSYIEEMLWSFNINFLQQFLPEQIQDFAEDILKPLQENCESSNEAIKSLVNWEKNKDAIVEEAVLSDGRGHFLSSYDGEEHELKIDGVFYYIYKN